eukprot:3171960-Prymnesium_polylepis.1
MAHAYASDALRSHARRLHTGCAMGFMCVYRTERGAGLTPLVPSIGAVARALPRPPPLVCMAHVRFIRAEASSPA